MNARAASCALLCLLLSAGTQATRTEAQTRTGTREPSGVAATDPAVRRALDAARQDLVELRFEKSLASIEALLGDPRLTEADRVEALILRAQTHGAFGDFDAVEQDYVEILRARPAYAPEPSLTASKAMDRFRKVRHALVGVVRLKLEPPTASVSVDGRPARPAPDGALPLLGGEHVLRAEAPGHDGEQTVVDVKPGTEVLLELKLLRNSRDVIVRTEPDGVTVRVDGIVMGRTERRGRQPAELYLPNVALGEHVIELSKSCYATERIQDLLTVDLLDTSPQVYGPLTLRPSRTTMKIVGEPAGAVVRVNGQDVGSVPIERLELCPGTVLIDVVWGGRRVFSSQQRLERDVPALVEVRPRPSAAVYGAGGWPAGLGQFGESFSTVGGLQPPAGVDLGDPAGWARVHLPPDTDLALAVVPAGPRGQRERWLLYSPVLGTVEPLEAAPAVDPRPTWYRPVWGMTLADSRVGGDAAVVEVVPGGPAARAGVAVGERIAAVSGRPVRGAEAALRAMDAAGNGGEVVLQVVGSTGQARGVKLAGSPSPVLLAPDKRGLPAAVLAAWAGVDAVVHPEWAPAALSNLALLHSATGNPAAAAAVWKRVRWPDRPGIGPGTAAYYLGLELLRLGREAEAVAALTAAARSPATTRSDEGPRVAPAAMDHLADLGVTPGAP